MRTLLGVMRRWGNAGALANVRTDLVRVQAEERAASLVVARVRAADERRGPTTSTNSITRQLRPVTARAA